MKAFVEGSGCSLNQSDTEQICGFLEKNNFALVQKPEEAELILINACAVKEQTESKMLARIKQLYVVSKKKNSRLLVFGCLPKICPEKVRAISDDIVLFGPSLEKLAVFLDLPGQSFSPEFEGKKSSDLISIIPIARGCVGNCAYCSVKQARGDLKSYSIGSLSKKFKKSLKHSKEIWLTAQDCGCYGFDIGTSLHVLLKQLLSVKGDYMVRVGMSNPGHVLKFLPEYLDAFSDKRMYKFFHVPVQSGSNSVLKAMNRPYSREDFLKLVAAIRSRFSDAVIATDVIVGFPGESEKDFEETLDLVRRTEPDVVNISRFGARPNTLAEILPGQLHGRVKKKRSRVLTELWEETALARSRSFVGTRQRILVNELGSKGNFVGRASNYKPVVVKKARLGGFLEVEIIDGFSTYLEAVPLK